MNIQQAPKPLPAKATSAESSAAPADKANNGNEAAIDRAAFAKLLQGAQKQDPALDLSPDLAQMAIDVVPELLNGEALLLGQTPSLTLETLPGSLEDAALDVDSLLSQTLRLDQRADESLRDGSYVWSQSAGHFTSAAGLAAAAGAQPRVAIGQEVATVAAGVHQPVGIVSTLSSSPESVAMAATALERTAVEVGDALSQTATELRGKESSSEGRFTLQGAWALEQPNVAPSAMLQRLMGQIEQWAVAGAQPKPSERNESGKAASEGSHALLHGQGSGMRLAENAVREAQQSQATAFETAQETPVQDMRFWLQGKQQRAELTLERDGQPVKVQVSVKGNEAHVTFLSDQQQTRDELDASLAQLREMLAQQGVELSGVSVQAQAQGGSHSPNPQSQQRDNEAAQQTDVQHARISVPASHEQSGGPMRGLDVYA